MIPKIRLILEYKHFYGSEAPTNRLEIIKNIPKINLLYEIAGLNYRLKPYNRLKYDSSLATQKRELEYFCPIDSQLLEHYAIIASQYTKSENDYPIIFNRAANLFAIEEILNCFDFPIDDDFQMSRVEVWDSIFQYLLAVNAEILKIKPIDPQYLSIESISASSIVLSELMIEDNPFYIPYKGIRLVDYLSEDPTYGPEIERYFNEILRIEKDQFFYNLLSLAMANGQDDYIAEFVYSLNKEDSFLEYLSQNRVTNVDPIILLSIKKTPFYKENDFRYIVLDINFLINKSYNFFINDFWFDFLKPQISSNGKAKFSFSHYRGVFGLFLESYLKEIFQNSFSFLNHPKPLLFDELKVKTSKGSIEIADIYVRQNNRILVGQVKSSSIYDNEKFSGEINTLYRNNREQFFVDFGVNQTLESIKNILNHSSIFDVKLNLNKKIEFFPIVVVNEKIFQTPLMPNLMHMRFNELMKKENFGKHIIHPLIVIHVSDLEYLESGFSERKIIIWDMLKSHYKQAKDGIMPPFLYSVDKYISPGSITKRAKERFYNIIGKYSNARE
jgi:hypothetical protein